MRRSKDIAALPFTLHMRTTAHHTYISRVSQRIPFGKMIIQRAALITNGPLR
jgi:hypothetical protein